MAIKNKDGTIYRLQSPSPQMENQNFWNDFQIHNIKSNPEIKSDDSPEVIPAKHDLTIKQSFLSDLIESKPEPIPEVIIENPRSIEKTIEVKPPEQKINLPQSIEKTVCHCLPAVFKEKIDNLYGEKRQNLEYLKPFTFEAIILDFNQFNLKLWTTQNDVKEHSIVFPKNGHLSWWKVYSREEKTGGWLTNLIPSSFQPFFE